MSRLNYPMGEIDTRYISSVDQFFKKNEIQRQRHEVEIQVLQSQLDTPKMLAMQQQQIAEMSRTIEELLKHNQQQAMDYEKREKEKEILEKKRSKINIALSAIAALTGIIGVIISIW